MDKNNREMMTKNAFEALRKVFLENGGKNPDADLLTALAEKIATRNGFVLGAFVAWERPDDAAPKGIPLTNGDVLFFHSSCDDSFKKQAKVTLGIIVIEKLYVSGLLHKQKSIRSKQVDIVHRCPSGDTCAPIADTPNDWYCNNQLKNLTSIFNELSEKEIAKRYITVVEGYFPKKDAPYIIVYCPFLVPDGKPPGNYFGVYECSGADQKDLLDHLAAIQHSGTMIYARRAMESKAEEILKHGKRSAIAAIMSRNMSHNIGSHVLTQIKDNDIHGQTIADAIERPSEASGTGIVQAKAAGDDIKALHAYLQRRMDLVARITSSQPDWGEPLWFLGDLLRGFVTQNILLNHLVEDQNGWREGKIKFHVKLNGSNDKCIKYSAASGADKAGWLKSLDSLLAGNLEDFLVSIPDGSVGAQAFYVFLESLMRNSAKYGKVNPKPPCFEIHFEVTDKTDYYELSIWDNLSICPATSADGKKLCCEMQDKIKGKLIDEQGVRTKSSLGIAEMREACRFLIHPYGDYPVYPPKDMADARGGCDHCSGDGCAAGQADRAGVQPDKGPFPLWVECQQENGQEYLRYRLHLAKPRMVAIVGLSDGTQLNDEARRLGISALERNDLLTQKGACQFAVIHVNAGNQDATFNWANVHRNKLPQRLLFAMKSDETPDINPVRGSVFCDKQAIELPSTNGKSSFEEFILAVYSTWVHKKWEADSKTIHVSFDRTKIPQRWVSETKNCNSPPFCVWMKNGTGNWIAAHDSSCREATGGVHFLNHGESSSHIQNPFCTIPFQNGDKTFDALSNPPPSDFGFCYFLWGLLEAALARVAITDERVALWSGADHNNRKFKRCKNARTYLVFKIGDEWLTGEVENMSKATPNNMQSMVALKSFYSWSINGFNCNISDIPQNGAVEADFLVLHAGVAETIGARLAPIGADQSKTWLFDQAKNCAQSVIATSGRGAVVNSEQVPFVEWSVLAEYFRENVSKYHLVKTLMSTRG